ncbi:hyphally regulated cell wall protein 3 [Xiphias gladius]|uniref:hyphally regulated cell wall protein 3 n=1 Tax=Xiphias gladius TaxID=8245 RepID=UPI001A99800C|nr:hyphally regulated cell wall protein 3 [Xiphias gladius]
MSLLSMVEEAIKSRKDEQAKINESIQFYREILKTLTPKPKTSSEESDCADAAATDTKTSPGETEDIDLLERALEKALWVRTGTETSKNKPDRNKESGSRKEPGTSAVTSKDVTQSSAPSKASQTTIKSTSKSKPGSSVSSTLGSRPSASNNPRQSKSTNYRNIVQKDPVSSARVVHHHTARKLQQAGSASGSLDHISTLHSKNKTVKSSVLSDDDLGKAAAISTPSSNDAVPLSHTDEPGAHSLLQHDGVPSEQAAKWKSLRSKQNRLWDEVIALQRKPVPGRSHFIERMRATFPKDWPCGSPDQARAMVDSLTHPGHDLNQHCQTKEVLANPTPEAATVRECEAWDRWRPEGGCLCPTGANSVEQDRMIEPLPLTITYTTEAELQELEKLRIRVALLQQEINLEQALLDTLSPQLSSIAPGPACPNPSMLRDMYSLLGEGGERFPAIVWDSESD